MADTPTTGRVVVGGGGYGGINAAKALYDVADVTLVDPTEAFVHNIAAWRALVDPAWLERIFFPYEHLLAHGRFLRDRAVAIDGRRVTLESGDVLEPDYHAGGNLIARAAVHGYTTAFWWSAGLFAAGAFITGLRVRGELRDQVPGAQPNAQPFGAA